MKFHSSTPFSLGAELELQLIDKSSHDLSSSSVEVLKLLKNRKGICPEIYQSMLEIKSDICSTATEVAGDLRQRLGEVMHICDRLGIEVISAGTHPWACYLSADTFPASRYADIIKRRKWIAKRMLVFGLHIHVGMRCGEHAIQTSNLLKNYLPLFVALSASSPFSSGQDTGLASSRTTFIESFPSGGEPLNFSNWGEFESVYARLHGAGAVESPKDLWWDIRPSPAFGTLEIRVCDSPSTVAETEAIVALIHLLCLKIERDGMTGGMWNFKSHWIHRENKWRAMSAGVGAEFIVDDKGNTMGAKEAFEELAFQMDDLVDYFGYASQMELLRKILTNGSSSDRQRAALKRSAGGVRHVVGSLIDELKTDQPLWLDSKVKGDGICA